MKQKSNKRDKTKEMFDKLVKEVTHIINSGQYVEFLRFSKSFHHYSFNNLVLIYSQMPDATRVAGFKTWEKFGRKLKNGEKGIQIFFPIKHSYPKNNITGQTSLISEEKSDENKKLQETIEYITYRPTYVFDISQTIGKPIPEASLCEKLNSNNMNEFFNFLVSFSPYPILEQSLRGSLYGYWSPMQKHIVLNQKLSLDDKCSTLLHELTHALYDDFDYQQDKKLSETFVESVAFIVADFFGLDTSKCSFNYIAAYASDVKVILDLGDKIQKTANQFIKQIKEYQEQGLKIIV